MACFDGCEKAASKYSPATSGVAAISSEAAPDGLDQNLTEFFVHADDVLLWNCRYGRGARQMLIVNLAVTSSVYGSG
jgi:hypothetical protein